MRSLRTGLIGAVIATGLVAFPASAQTAVDDIDFGDDASTWSNDGECDDPRFQGEGMAASTNREDLLHDATDCRTLLQAGKITLSASQYDPTLTTFEGIELGNDDGRYPNDGVCDDPRFEGTGMSPSPDHPEIGGDKSDCSYGLQLGELTVADDVPPPLELVDGIDFGNDKGSYAGDGECDDPRFAGNGMASISLEVSNMGGDRTDCLAAYQTGEVRFIERSVIDGIDFGDNRNIYASDDACDDPRFDGAGMGAKPGLDGLKHDAADCMAAWRSNTISPRLSLDAGGYVIKDGIFFGEDSGTFANDGECDDPTFTGRTMAASGGSLEYAGRDQTDCLSGYNNGDLKLAPPVPVLRIMEADGIKFGDDNSAFANDGECDDPRFEGLGMATSLIDSDRLHDASDCLALYESGDIRLRE
ncbi:MAG: hypothetical protein AAFY34_04710 [Pseudomonadota bacterium]